MDFEGFKAYLETRQKWISSAFCEGRVGRNMVPDEVPVTVTGNGADSLLPPVRQSSEGLFSVGPQTVTSEGPVTVTGHEPLSFRSFRFFELPPELPRTPQLIL